MMDYVIGAILIAVSLVTIGIIIGMIARFVDSCCLPVKRAQGKITAKDFIEAHTQIIYIYSASTKTNLPHPIHHPDDWSLTIEVDEKEDSVSIEETLYNTVSIGDTIEVDIAYGRFSRNLYIKEVYS